MKDLLKYLLKLLMRFSLKAYWLFPIQKRVFFMSTMGKNFSCNPKYIYESMLHDQRFDDYIFVWAFQDPVAFKDVKVASGGRTQLVSKKSLLRYFYYLLTSRVVIYNCGGFSYAPIRKSQYLVETWHGGGTFKRIGYGIGNKSASSKRGIAMAMKDIRLFLGTSRLNDEQVIRNSMSYPGEIISSGFPRNDLLFSQNEQLVVKVKRQLNIGEQHVVLYAPTFKGDESSADNVSNNLEIISPNMVKEALSSRFGGQWIFATRGHQYAGDLQMVDADADWSNYPDMQELLLISDVLITDYSSSIWDFSLTRKPTFLYAPDLTQYSTTERGFYDPIQTWPAVLTTQMKSLHKSIINFDQQAYNKRVEKYLSHVGSFEDGGATKKVLDRIFVEIS